MRVVLAISFHSISDGKLARSWIRCIKNRGVSVGKNELDRNGKLGGQGERTTSRVEREHTRHFVVFHLSARTGQK
jgi:hypothetical protein